MHPSRNVEMGLSSPPEWVIYTPFLVSTLLDFHSPFFIQDLPHLLEEDDEYLGYHIPKGSYVSIFLVFSTMMFTASHIFPVQIIANIWYEIIRFIHFSAYTISERRQEYSSRWNNLPRAQYIQTVPFYGLQHKSEKHGSSQLYVWVRKKVRNSWLNRLQRCFIIY